VNDEDDNNACSQVLDLIELLMGCAHTAIQVYARLPREQLARSILPIQKKKDLCKFTEVIS
jgi:hypothetical protein